jgi:LysM repeat protein
VTVFIWSSPTYPELHTDIYVDDASLIAVGQGDVPTATPAGAGTPQPTATLGTPQPTPTIPPNTGTYTIQSGDTLSAIALTYNLTLDQLLALNPSLTRDSILQVGQVINVGGTPQAATPAPTATLEPAATLAATAVPTTTLATATPVPNGTPALANSGLCLSAYYDANGDGTHQSTETDIVSAVRFDVLDAQNKTVESYVSNGNEAVHCLSNLPDGRYTINITPPPDYTPTTDVKWSVSLLSGTSVNVTFGSTIAPAATATSEAAPTAQAEAAATPGPAERSTGAPLGLLIGGALVLLAIAALAFAFSSRRR